MSNGDAFEELDASDITSPDDLKGYDYPAAGIYHCVVNKVDAGKEKVGGIKFEGQILAGTVANQQGKTWWETMWDPSPDHKDGGKFMRKRKVAFALAVGLITPAQLGKPVSINWDLAVGRQFVAKLDNYERISEKDKKTYKGAEVEGLNFWPVNHADVAAVPKDQVALGLLGQQAAAPQQQGQVQQPAQVAASQQGGADWKNF